MHPAYDLGGTHPAHRVLAQVRWNTDAERRHADGTVEPVPTPRQVAAVLRALGDYTHNVHVLGRDVASLGADEDTLDPQATALGRYFHGLADELRWLQVDAEEAVDASREAPAGDDSSDGAPGPG